MLKELIHGLLAGTAMKLFDSYRRKAVQLVKIEAAKCYLHGVRVARLSAIGLTTMWLTIGLIFAGALLFHAGLFMILPWSAGEKAALCMFLGVIYAAIGVATLRWVMSERTWMEKSGAIRMLDEATGRDDSE